MGHAPPKDPAVAAGIPSLKWPHIWVAVTGYLLIACISDFSVGVDNKADAIAALIMLPLCVLFFLAALGFRKHRIEQRHQWRRDRFKEWALSPAPPAPIITDWEKFELEAARKVEQEERPERSPFTKPKMEQLQKRDKSGKYKHPAESHHVEWAKGGVMRGDWWAR